MEKKDIYTRVTEQIITNLENAGSWQKLWSSPQPISLNKHKYKGINYLLLSHTKYNSPVWGTFDQVRKNGGKVNKGEHSTIVVFWKQLTKKDTAQESKEEKENNTFWFLAMYNVFNTEQCTFDELGTNYINNLINEVGTKENKEIISANTIIENYINKPTIHNLPQDSAYYSPVNDEIVMPQLKYFVNSDEYYSTLFHECIHSTGHAKRLNRFNEIKSHSHNKEDYSKEELVAELGASYLSYISNIELNIKNTQAYIKGWSNKLKEKNTWLVWAASQAEKATKYILNEPY